jgi:sulfopyruvate decarboxylase TPP-binding subunit
MFTGKAPWTIIAEVVDAVRIPVTGNGDVHSVSDARRMVAETRCQSVMIGRGALGSPWVFDEAWESMSPAAQRAYRARVIARHVTLIKEHFQERFALIQLKKHLSWYTEGLGHARECRAAIFQTQTADEVWDIFQRYWSGRNPRRRSFSSPRRHEPAPGGRRPHGGRRLSMQRMTGGQALVASLYREGVRVVFGLPGVQLYGAVAALRDEPRIRVITTRHEQATTYMADGYARAGGGIGVALVVPGPGLLNASAGLSTAYSASSPVLVIAGQIPKGKIGQNVGLLHEVNDQLDAIAPVTKWRQRVLEVAEIPAAVREAMRQLRTGRPRPVVIDIRPRRSRTRAKSRCSIRRQRIEQRPRHPRSSAPPRSSRPQSTRRSSPAVASTSPAQTRRYSPSRSTSRPRSS